MNTSRATERMHYSNHNCTQCRGYFLISKYTDLTKVVRLWYMARVQQIPSLVYISICERLEEVFASNPTYKLTCSLSILHQTMFVNVVVKCSCVLKIVMSPTYAISATFEVR